jgi:glycosyltransferase involved in cell wall biosynthesis
MRETISACVIAFNEEVKLRRCLDSVKWCDEIVVLDSFSTDNTVAVAREFTDKVFQQQWLGYVGQRNTVREMARGPWLLFMDADEEFSPGLRDEILKQFERGHGKYLGYEFPRQVYYLGKWIKHGEWYPDVKLRLFKKEFGRTEGVEPHDHVVVRGPVKRLRNPIWHYTYDNVVDHLNRLNRYSTITAQQRFAAGDRFHWPDLILHPWFRFLKGYILRRGFMDGTHGLAIAAISAFGAFLKYVKLWELNQTRRHGYSNLPPPAE